MSKSIDERIVKMSFQNDNFENGVKSTLSALDKLKASLDMSGAKTKFTELATAANGVKIDGLSSQVENLSGKFEGMRVVALGALAAIGAKVVDLGIQFGRDLVNNMTKAARDGFAEYETQINAIQSILSNTKFKGENIDTVNAALDSLNHYSDQTIYNFTEMVSGIKTLTTAGMNLSPAVDTVKGFANVAALAGTNSQQMASALQYGLTQAISKGKMLTQDWMSLETSGMASEAFRNSLIETARVNGVAVDEMIANNGSFRESLKEGWLTSDILQQTLAKFTGQMSDEQLRQQGYTEDQIKSIQDLARTAVDSATKVKTITQLVGTIQEQIGSGWATSWRKVVGDFEEAQDLFTNISKRISDMIQPSIDARNAQLDLWREMGGRTALVQSIYNVFDALKSIMDPIKKSFQEVFPPKWGETLAHISIAIEKFTRGLILSETASENLGKVVKLFLLPIKFILDTVAGAFQVLWAVIKMGFGLLGSLIGLVTPLVNFFISLIPPMDTAGEKTESFADILTKFIEGGIQPVIDWISKLGSSFNDFLNGNTVTNKISAIKQGLVDVGGAIAMVWNVLAKGDFTGNAFFAEDSKFVDVLFKIREGAVAVGEAIGKFFGNIKTAGKTAGDVIGNVWNYLTGIAKDAGPAFADIGKAIQKGLAGVQMEHVLAALNTGVLIAVGVGFKKMFDSIRGVFDGAAGIFDGLKTALGSISGVLEGMQKKLKADALLRIAAAIGILAISLAILAGIDPDRLMSAAIGMGTALGALIVATKIMSKMADMSAKDSAKMVLLGIALIELATAVMILATALKIIGSMSWDELIKGLIGISVALGLLVGAAKLMSGFEKDIVKSAAAMILMATAITMLAGAVAIFGNMPMDVLIQGGIAVAVALGLLTGAAVLLSKFAPDMVLSAVGLMAMAAAINMLILPITTLGLLPMDILIQGMIAVGIAIGGLVLAAQAMSAIAPQMAIAAVGMMAMAAAINMLVGPITILGTIGLDTLIQGLFGLAAVMAILVIASNAMTGAIVGAGAMIVMAGAILILAAAISIIGGMPMEQIIQGIIGIAAGMLVIGAAAAVLGLAAPLLLAGAAGLLLVGVAMVAMAGAVVIFAIGLAMLGPALTIATGGLWAFAQVAPKIAEAVPSFLAIGAGLLVFGAGALVAGAGILVLGVGLAALGAGLALVGIFGPIGTIALTAFVLALGKLAGEMPNMLAMSGVFIALGAGALALGLGMTALGVGGLLAGVALIALVPMGALITVSFNLITAAINKLLPQTEKLGQLATNFNSLGKAISKVGSAGSGAASGMAATAAGFTLMAATSALAGVAVAMMGALFVANMTTITSSSRTASTGFTASVLAMIQSLNTFKMALSSAAGPIEASARQIGRSVGPSIVAEINGSAGAMRDAGYNVGRAITDGMSNGVRSGQNNVTAAATQVAKAALAASKNTLGVRSPSREYFKVGAFSSEGQALGILSEMGQVTDASSDVGKAAIKALQDSLSSANNTPNMLGFDDDPVITPVFDLTQLQKGASIINGMLSNPKLDVDGMRANANATRDAVQQTTDDNNAAASEVAAPIQFTQINNSPKALSNAEIYRRTKNQLSVAKGALTTANAQPS